MRPCRGMLQMNLQHPLADDWDNAASVHNSKDKIRIMCDLPATKDLKYPPCPFCLNTNLSGAINE